MLVYVASSWRNLHQQEVVRLLRMDHGEDAVYDYRHPDPTDRANVGFSWKDVDDEVLSREPDAATSSAWTGARLSRALDHPIAAKGFALDVGALDACAACVLVLPCGRSAHLELGYAAGRGKLTVVYAPKGSPVEPELMYRLCDYLVDDVEEVRRILTQKRPPPRWQRDIADLPRDGPIAECRPYLHRECPGCKNCWRHGECTCSPENLYAATCGKPVVKDGQDTGHLCIAWKNHEGDCREGS